MGRVFLCYKPLHPPTGVEHCCFARFTSPYDQNLIISHANILEIYTLHTLPDGEIVSEISASYALAGRLEAINILPLHRSELPDVLLITFRPAKAVLVAFEREAAELIVLDLYSFEHDAIGVGSAVRAEPPDVDRLEGIGDMAPTIMDPNARCAAMLIYGSQVAMMPFKREALGKRVLRIMLSSRPDQAARRAELPVRISPRTTLATAMLSKRRKKRKRDTTSSADQEAAAAAAASSVAGRIRRVLSNIGDGHLDLAAGGVGRSTTGDSAAVPVGGLARGTSATGGAGGASQGGDPVDDEDDDDDTDAEYDEEEEEEVVVGEGGGGNEQNGGLERSASIMNGGEKLVASKADELEGAEFERELGGEKPFMIKLRDELQIRGVIKDLCFLGGFMQPTLAILHMQPPSWGGIVAARAHSGHLSVISCGLSSASGAQATNLFHVGLLPHDSFRIISPPEPLAGGVLVVSASALHFIQEGRVRTTVATNGFGPTSIATARHPLQPPEETGLMEAVSLEGARLSFLKSNVALMSIGTGELIGIRIQSQAGRVTALRLQKLGGGHGMGIFASEMAVQREANLLFLASRTVDSLLLRFTLKAIEPSEELEEGLMSKPEPPGGGESNSSTAAEAHGMDVVVDEVERIPSSSSSALQNGNGYHFPRSTSTTTVGRNAEDEEEIGLYGAPVAVELTGPHVDSDQIQLGSRVTLSIADAFPSLGPLMGATLAPRLPRDYYEHSPLLAPENIDENDDAQGDKDKDQPQPVSLPPGFRVKEQEVELICCAGQGKKGSLVVMRRGINAETLGRAALPSPVQGIWVLPSAVAEEEDDSTPLGGFVVVSLDQSTVIFRYLGQGLEREQQPGQLGFHIEAPTRALESVGSSRGLVQIYEGGNAAGGLRLIWDGVPTQEMLLHDEVEVGGVGVPPGVAITSVSIQDPFILLVLANGGLVLLGLDESDGEFVPYDTASLIGQEGVGRNGRLITAACMFRWRRGLGMGSLGREGSDVGGGLEADEENVDDEDEEDAVLYGGGAATTTAVGRAAAGGEGEVHMMDQDGPAMNGNGTTTAAAAALNGQAEGGGEGMEEEVEPEVIYCALCRADGSLEVYSLPDLHPVFLSARCGEGPCVLRNALLFKDLTFRPRRHAFVEGSVEEENNGFLNGSSDMNKPPFPTIKEMSIAVISPAATSAGSGNTNLPTAASLLERLVITLWTSEDDLLVYQARPLVGAIRIDPEALPWTLLRLPHDLITRSPRYAIPVEGRVDLQRRLYTPSSPIGGQRGVFVGGETPAWIMCERGAVMVVPARIRDSYTTIALPSQAHISAFAPFPDAESGFMVAHTGQGGKSTLSLLSLDLGGTLGYITTSGASSGANMTFRRIGPLGIEAKIVVALEVPTTTPFYAVMMARGEGLTAFDEAEDEGGEEAIGGGAASGGVEDEEEEEGGGGRGKGSSKTTSTAAATTPRLTDFTAPNKDYLGAPHVPGSWAGGHQIWVMGGAPFAMGSIIKLKQHERGLAMMLLRLPTYPEERSEGLFGKYLVVGTCVVRSKGEDVPAKGRLVVYRVGIREGKATLTEVAEASQRSGPPTAIAQVNDRIIMAGGPTLWVYSFFDEKLKPIAFYDADFYVVSLRVVKSFIAVTDAYHSVHLLRWHETDPTHTLDLLGKGYEHVVTAQPAAHFVVDPPSLGVLFGDNRGNIQVLQYDQYDVESRGGDKLLRRADFHLGHRLSFIQHCRPGTVARPGAISQGLRLLIFGTEEGGAGALIPLEEKVFRRLYALQAVMVNALAHPCALNPRGYRLFESRGILQERKKTMLDGELLWRYPSLDVVTQEDLASAVGTNRELILDTLLEVDMMTWVL